jgi:imidazolonepropionase-like amidohydrolase
MVRQWIRRVLHALVSFVSLVSALLQVPGPPPERLILEHVTVIDGTGRPPVPGQSIVIEGDRIVRVASAGAVGPGERGRRIDLRGRYVMPGLIDMHAHMAFGPVQMTSVNGAPAARLMFDARVGRDFARELLQWGVTTVRNPAGPTREAIAIRDAIRRGELPGPRILTAGEVIDQMPFEGLAATVRSVDDVRAEVNRQADAGVDFIKLYAGLTPPLVKAGIDAAHARGLQAVGHLWLTDWKTAADLGIDGIVHALPLSDRQLPESARATYMKGIAGTQAMFQWFEHADIAGAEMTAAARAMAERGVSFDPTLVTVEAMFFGDESRFTAQPSLARVTRVLVENWAAFTRSMGWTADDYRRAKLQFPKALELVGRLHRAGVRIVAGTDLAMPWVIPGEGLHRELELLVRAGLSPLEAIAAATGNAARALRLEHEIGTIAAGRRADLVILSRNPSTDVTATRAIVSVMQGGTWLRR